MPENIIELLVTGLFGAGGLVALLRARTDARRAQTERQKIVSDAAEAAKVSTAKEWEALAASQRSALEEYRCRLVAVTDRVRELERELVEARKTIQRLEDCSQEQALKIKVLEQEREDWETERTILRARIAELEGCR